ncbi:MAG: hypothetical protein ACRD33_00070 [Candidatus Acidiferrales bacterium]
MARAGSGVAYIPRFALQGLGQDDDDLLDDTSDDFLSDEDIAATVEAPDTDALDASLDTYDADTGQVLSPSGTPVSSSLISSISNSIASIFGGGTQTAAINASGVSGDTAEIDLMPLFLVVAGAGILYLVFRDR